MAKETQAESISSLTLELKSVKKSLSKTANDLSRSQGKVADLTEKLSKKSGEAERYKGIAAKSEKHSNALVKQIKALNADIAGSIAGSFEVRTKKAQTILGTHAQAGTLIGYVTPIAGLEPIAVTDSVAHGSAGCQPTAKHDAFVDSAVAKENTEKLAAAHKQIEEMARSLNEQGQELGNANLKLGEANETIAALEDEKSQLVKELEEATEPEPETDEDEETKDSK